MATTLAHVINVYPLHELVGEDYTELTLSYLKKELFDLYGGDVKNNACQLEEWVLHHPDLGETYAEFAEYVNDELDDINRDEYVQSITLALESSVEAVMAMPEYKQMEKYLRDHRPDIKSVTFNSDTRAFIMVTSQ